jgi:hypothetical protein
MLDVALAYRAFGCSVLPTIPGSKKPAVLWKEFQSRRASETEIREWYRVKPRAGVIIVCGRVSGIIVGDIDPRNGGDLELAKRFTGPLAETPSGGLHGYFADHAPKVPALLPGVDLQGERSYVVAPPTVRVDGRYRWLPGRALGEVPLPPLPAFLRQLVLERDYERTRSRSRHDGSASEAPRDVGEILRRLDAVRRAGAGWLARCPAHEDREPSLSIGIGQDGKVLLHCFAGCAFEAILDAVSGARA